MKKLLNKKFLIVSIVVTFVLAGISGAVIVSSIPDEIILFNNEKLDVGKIFTVETATDSGGVLKDGVLGADESDGYFAEVKLAGVLPVKTVKVSVLEQQKVVLGGNSIGVKLYTDGLMVVGISDFETIEGGVVSPARNSGLRTGDIIKTANGQAVEDANDLSQVLNRCQGTSVTLEIIRKGQSTHINVLPKADVNNSYKLGAWIRNSVAGIGTMTFYNPEKNVYGALGHGITDSDTNDVVPIGKGEVVPARVTSVKRSEKGAPGELHGYFSDSAAVCDVRKNTSSGIYGNVTEPSFFSGEVVDVATREEISEGKAQILSCIDENEINTFEIEIERISHRKDVQTKCMVIRVTDENLLKETGGILQGMSGSPIVQNGKLVGAVTHVFLNDPTRGYAIFADTMVKNSLAL